MSARKRPLRVWQGTPGPVDPAELVGPRGFTAEVLGEDERPGGDAEAQDGAHEPRDGGRPALAASDPWGALLTPARIARIDSVVAARLASVTLVLDRLLDPHNVAAALRTAEALGLSRVHVVPHEDGELGAHRKITQDADKWLDVVRHESGSGAAQALAGQGFAVYAGHLDDRAVLLEELPADRPVALLFGNEHEGPGAKTVAACAGTFRIPMAGFTQSFNVSVAAAIALAHQTRARRAALGAAGDLPPAEQDALRLRFYERACKLARRVKQPPPVRS